MIYPLVAVDGAQSVRELRELVYLPQHARSEELPVAADLLAATYDDCRRSHVTKKKSIVLGPEYESYLRDTDERLLDDPLPHLFDGRDRIEVHGHVMRDPRRILQAVKSLELDTTVCPVHGDLHPNNVLFGPKYAPVLIDYAFGHEGHFIKDFVLMECSLRFLLAPRLLQPDIFSYFDDLLLEESGYLQARQLNVSGRAREIIEEMSALVDVIRTQCRHRVPGYDFSEYLLAQYLILMGNIRLYPYQEFRTLRTLCRLAEELENRL